MLMKSGSAKRSLISLSERILPIDGGLGFPYSVALFCPDIESVPGLLYVVCRRNHEYVLISSSPKVSR